MAGACSTAGHLAEQAPLAGQRLWQGDSHSDDILNLECRVEGGVRPEVLLVEDSDTAPFRLAGAVDQCIFPVFETSETVSFIASSLSYDDYGGVALCGPEYNERERITALGVLVGPHRASVGVDKGSSKDAAAGIAVAVATTASGGFFAHAGFAGSFLSFVGMTRINMNMVVIAHLCLLR